MGRAIVSPSGLMVGRGLGLEGPTDGVGWEARGAAMVKGLARAAQRDMG